MHLITPRIIKPFQGSTQRPSCLRFFTVSHDLCRKSYRDLTDEERRVQLDRARAVNNARYKVDPEFRAKISQKSTKAWLAKKHDDLHKLQRTLRRWVKAQSWIREELPWKSHKPAFFDKRVERYCTGCAWTKKEGAQIWWVKSIGVSNSYDKLDGQEYLCIGCYTKRGHEEAMPAGYEDIKRYKDLLERKKQLDGTWPDPPKNN